MINLGQRSSLHWLTAWARRVGARLAGLVDLIAATCHETLGVFSATIADAINRQIVDPLVRHNFPSKEDLREPLRDILRCRNEDGLMALGISLDEQKRLDREAAIARRLPKWWRKFDGFERWCHDGTCGFAVDRPWMFKHWPSSVVIEVATFKVLLNTEAFTAAIDKLAKQINSMSAIVLPKGLEFEFIPSAEREGPRAELGLPPFVMYPRGSYARIEAQRRALACDFPGFARRYFDTGHMRRSVRMGENAGINALTGELTAWLPEPEEAEATQEPLRELNVPEGAELELSGPVWGPSPTREFFRQMRAHRKERPVRDKFRVVVDVPLRENAEVTELVCQQIASIITPGLPEGVAVKILCNEGDDIVKVPRVGEDEASTLTPEPGEPDEAASGDEIKEDGTASDLKDEDEAPE